MVLLIVSVMPTGSPAGEPPVQPQVRVEIGPHSAPINGVATDAAGKRLATVSFDKTLRIWSAETGELIRILRPPIGDGDEGAMYTVALSPDGKTVAASGWTGSWDGTWSAYLFNTETGVLTRRIDQLPERCVNLAFSSDGKRLAAALKGKHGIRVYDTANFELAWEDRDYDDDAVWMDYASDGRLVVTSLDGKIRLYGRGGKRVAKKPGKLGVSPYGVKFSPDGMKIAVGYLDGPKVEVLSGDTLEHLFQPNLRGADNGFLQQVAWSRDGNTLFAGGSYERGGKTPIRRWDKTGKGRPKDYPIASKRVMHMVALPDGRLAYVAADPAIGVLDTRGKTIFEQRPEVGDFRGLADSFGVSADGGTVAFSFAPWGEQPARFSLARRELILDPEDDHTALRLPRLEAPGVTVEGWNNDLRDWGQRETPTVNGHKITLKPHETAMSLAISSDAEAVVLGTGWRIIRLDKAGKTIWETIPPGEALALNVTADDKILVAALGDGTIRWYRMKDGSEILALFAMGDGKRWVTWTPHGDYVASAEGDTLVGWHVNRGKTKSSAFHAVARFRELHYQPKAISHILATATGATAPQTRDMAALVPPHVTVLSHRGVEEFNDRNVTVHFRLDHASSRKVTRIHVRANGRPVGEIEGEIELTKRGMEETVDIELPPRNAIVEVIAETADGVTSEPARVQFIWKGEKTSAAPKLYILAIGISEYRAKSLRLGLAAKDARDFQNVIRKRAGPQYGEISVKALSNGEATLTAVRDALSWIAAAPGPEDIAMVFLAGHGVDDEQGRYYFVPQDADPNAMAETGLPYEELRNALSSVRGRVFFFIDTCKSGAVWGRDASEPSIDVGRVLNDLKSPEHGVVVFASSTGKQFSLEKPDWRNGAFTKALVEGLNGKADLFGEGAVTVASLDAYISNRVTKLTGGRQTPATGKPVGPDFTLVSLR